MIKKILLSIAALLVLAVGLGFAFKEPLKEVVYQQITSDMFVEADDDNFEPGAVGTYEGDVFPAVRVAYLGSELSTLSQFNGSKGLVVLFSRSVVW